ncbi:unnamed protein product [Vicia faba]|uniref:Uncharacterized protein n=1 Tax=Vicia faba TaxID=3906 RepID=A0AAV0YUS5_VICFA|nr:unnamed protein product [Vicia faba]
MRGVRKLLEGCGTDPALVWWIKFRISSPWGLCWVSIEVTNSGRKFSRLNLISIIWIWGTLPLRSLQKSRNLNKCLDDLLAKEEVIWRQRNRALWLHKRDKDTSFFHGKASQQKKTNSIVRIKDASMIWCKKEDDIERIFRTYFNELFTSSKPVGAETITEVVKDIISGEDCDWYRRPFDSLDIK